MAALAKQIYISSLKSENGLFHATGAGCHHQKQILKENQLRFKTREKAEKRGLKLCRVCRQRMKQRRLGEYL
ncbi:MAG: hypothetical protein V1875_03340 [Candidatus Altiarchaeota archaeon]